MQAVCQQKERERKKSVEGLGVGHLQLMDSLSKHMKVGEKREGMNVHWKLDMVGLDLLYLYFHVHKGLSIILKCKTTCAMKTQMRNQQTCPSLQDWDTSLVSAENQIHVFWTANESR